MKRGKARTERKGPAPHHVLGGAARHRRIAWQALHMHHEKVRDHARGSRRRPRSPSQRRLDCDSAAGGPADVVGSRMRRRTESMSRPSAAHRFTNEYGQSRSSAVIHW